MPDWIDFIHRNKEWVFSGIGVFFLTIIGAIAKKFLFNRNEQSSEMGRIKQIQKSGNNSTNIQSGNDITINLSSQEDKK